MCYSILYVDKHGRKLKDPWSLRQLGVYHQISSDYRSSHCILLDLAKHAEPYLNDFIESSSGRSKFAFHVELLVSLSSNWTEYIEYLDSELRDHVREIPILDFPVVSNESRTTKRLTQQLITQEIVLRMFRIPIYRSCIC